MEIINVYEKARLRLAKLQLSTKQLCLLIEKKVLAYHYLTDRAPKVLEWTVDIFGPFFPVGLKFLEERFKQKVNFYKKETSKEFL